MRPALLRQVAAFVATVVVIQLASVAGEKAFLLTQLTMSAYYTLVVLGLSLFMGYAGQISLGHAAFFAVGGYTSAVMTTFDLGPFRSTAWVAAAGKVGLLATRTDAFGSQVLAFHPWPAMACAVLLTAAIAFAVGVPVLKLKGHYLAMATLGLGTIVYSVALGTATLGAADGISGVPPLPVLPGIAVGGNGSRIANYYVAGTVLAVSMLLLLNLVHSRVGRALRAIHGAEDAASAMGVDTAHYKVRTFVLSAAMAGLAGVLLTHYNGSIGPSEASIMKSVKYVAIVAVGGMGSLWGTLAASMVLNFLSLRGYFGTLDDAVFGTILVVVMLFAPQGILAIDLRRALRYLRPTRGAPAEPG